MSTHALDEKKLAGYLETQIEGFKGPLTAEKFSGGQSNPTYMIKAASGNYVLRRKPPGQLLKSAHAVDREYRVISALANTDVPVPRALHLCEDDDVIGSMFYLMSFEQGKIYWDAALPEFEPADRPAIYDSMNQTLASLHNIDLEATGLTDYGRPGNYFERQINRWSQQYEASATEDIAAMNQLMKWLPANMPPDDGRISLLHGDFRLDNMMFHPTEKRVIALLDWELSTIGHPLADLSYYCMSLRLPGLGEMKGLAGQDFAVLNIPTEQAFIEKYCERTGISGIDNWNFYLAFSFFRLSAILQGVLKRALDGNASNSNAEAVGRMAKPLAELAVGLIEQD